MGWAGKWARGAVLGMATTALLVSGGVPGSGASHAQVPGGAAQGQQSAAEAIVNPPGDPQFAPGEAVYRQICAACHDNGLGRAPQKYMLQQMSPETIHRVLSEGVMRAQGAALSAQEKTLVAEYLAQRRIGSVGAAPLPACTGAAARFDWGQPPVFDGWGLDPASTHHVGDGVAGITRANVGHLRLKWALAFPGANRVRSQPVLAGGALYIGSSTGRVYALDRASGCLRWSFDADSEVRTSVLISGWRPSAANRHPLAWFGDYAGNFYAVDAVTGKQVWKHSIGEHPEAVITASPAIAGGTLYVPVSSMEEAAAANPAYACCTFRGSIVALDGASGRVKWRRWLVETPRPGKPGADGHVGYGPSGVAVWSTPSLDLRRGLLFVGTGNTYSGPESPLGSSVVALALADGSVRWHYHATKGDVWNVGCIMGNGMGNCPEDAGPDYDFGAGTVLARGGNGRQVLMAGQKSGLVYGLDPASGRLLWQTRVGRGGAAGGVHFGMAAVNGLLLAPVNDMPDPRASSYPLSPGLHALDVASGGKRWSAIAPNLCQGVPLCQPGLGGAVTVTGQLAFAGGADGHVRAYDLKDGRVLWDYDSRRDYRGLGGIAGKGGALAGGIAPIAYKGELFVGSGYGFAGKLLGNMLLAFTVE